MSKAWLLSMLEWLKFGGRLLLALPQAGWRAFIPRLLIFCLIWPLSGLLSCLHWLGFLLDEVLFRAYRHVDIRQPTFILGIPRSGTTWLQRVIAKDANMTSLTLWECILAPSISQRYAVRALAILLRPLSKATAVLMSVIPFKGLKEFDAIHELGLSEPEEDFLLLLPLHACFLYVLLCPNARHYWNLARFDEAIAAKKRATIMRFYTRCVQKHLYFHGPERFFLSKNPSFTPFISSLREHFPDANIVACAREPEATIPSQLSSLLPAAKLLGMSPLPPAFIEQMTALLEHYYQLLCKHQQLERFILVQNAQLTSELYRVVSDIYQRCNLTMSNEFAQQLQQLEQNGKRFRSQHRYTVDLFDLDEQAIHARFSPYWAKLQTIGTPKL